MDGSPLELFAAMPWAEYLNTMAQNLTYGDQLTLQALANLHLVEIIVVSSLGPEVRTVISPQNCEPVARVFLGHFSEDEGIHYVCLVATNRVNQESDEETNSSEGNENILEDSEENEHEQNHYENGIEDDVVLSNDEQNVTNTEKHVEQLEELQQQQQPQEEQHEAEQQEKEQKGEKLQRKLNWNRCQRRSLI